ncbi:hypothetical protein UFOVP1305_80 [uncultured Caudovirales phage]|uniref:Uncharacterized protein n=1 Tax=uncultured Caudovirales phage TaxID=2100421 RepID=A0A6J5RLX7_9CAUD|nr:hypothetical protein UFOVP896_25 [uncultured Caudovirales phage]CAB4198393.1 hypothetical protein UFOVP1305_80 [uncultured Caudovirales phage]
MKASQSNKRVGVHYQEDDTCLDCFKAIKGEGSFTYITADELALGETFCSQCGDSLAERV